MVLRRRAGRWRNCTPPLFFLRNVLDLEFIDVLTGWSSRRVFIELVRYYLLMPFHTIGDEFRAFARRNPRKALALFLLIRGTNEPAGRRA